MRSDGSEQRRLTRNTAVESSRVVWSPDGTRVAFHATQDGDSDVYVVEVATGSLRRLTNHIARDRFPTWSPDGRSLAFTTDRDGDDEIYVMHLDGSGLRRLTTSPGLDVLDAWQR
jgi:TolB protein